MSEDDSFSEVSIIINVICIHLIIESFGIFSLTLKILGKET